MMSKSVSLLCILLLLLFAQAPVSGKDPFLVNIEKLHQKDHEKAWSLMLKRVKLNIRINDSVTTPDLHYFSKAIALTKDKNQNQRKIQLWEIFKIVFYKLAKTSVTTKQQIFFSELRKAIKEVSTLYSEHLLFPELYKLYNLTNNSEIKRIFLPYLAKSLWLVRVDVDTTTALPFLLKEISELTTLDTPSFQLLEYSLLRDFSKPLPTKFMNLTKTAFAQLSELEQVIRIHMLIFDLKFEQALKEAHQSMNSKSHTKYFLYSSSILLALKVGDIAQAQKWTQQASKTFSNMFNASHLLQFYNCAIEKKLNKNINVCNQLSKEVGSYYEGAFLKLIKAFSQSTNKEELTKAMNNSKTAIYDQKSRIFNALLF